MIRATLALMAFALPAHAQTLSGPEATLLPRIIDSACVDLVEEHIGCEQVVLLTSDTVPDAADLIVLTDRRSDPGGMPLLIARGIVFNGLIWGMSPSLAQADNGSLLLTSEQVGIGRLAWTQTLTLALRDGGLMVAGYTWSSYDRLGAGLATCDVNLLTGDFVASAVREATEGQAEVVLLDERGRIAPMAMPATDWTIDTPAPAPCVAATDRLYED